MKEFFRPPSYPSNQEIQKEGDKLGGSDWKDWDKYTKEDCVPSYDKGGHKERSIANDPNHSIFWKKQE